VIISTNIAETSVTIRGVKHVVDCGRVKAKYASVLFDTEIGILWYW